MEKDIKIARQRMLHSISGVNILRTRVFLSLHFFLLEPIVLLSLCNSVLPPILSLYDYVLLLVLLQYVSVLPPVLFLYVSVSRLFFILPTSALQSALLKILCTPAMISTVPASSIKLSNRFHARPSSIQGNVFPRLYHFCTISN